MFFRAKSTNNFCKTTIFEKSFGLKSHVAKIILKSLIKNLASFGVGSNKFIPVDAMGCKHGHFWKSFAVVRNSAEKRNGREKKPKNSEPTTGLWRLTWTSKNDNRRWFSSGCTEKEKLEVLWFIILSFKNFHLSRSNEWDYWPRRQRPPKNFHIQFYHQKHQKLWNKFRKPFEKFPIFFSNQKHFKAFLAII